MNYNIDKNAQEPAYIQLYRFLVKDIVAGVYEYGTKLPSKRVIAAETGISVITVEHALTLLNDEGYVESRPRSGVVVTYRNEDFLGAREPVKVQISETVTEGPNTSDFPFSVLTKTMRRVMLDYGEKILIKSPNHGCLELRNELCLYLARSRGLLVKPDQVRVEFYSKHISTILWCNATSVCATFARYLFLTYFAFEYWSGSHTCFM